VTAAPPLPSSSAADDRRPKLILITACLALFVSTLDNTVVNVALPSIGSSLRAGTVALQWVVASYVLVRGCLLLSAGALGDRYGRRRMFQFGLVVFGVGSLLCSVATDPAMLIGFRVLQAMGGCFLVPSSLALITEAYPEQKARARAIGIWSATTAASTGLGPPIGGLLVDTLGWRSVFWVNIPVVAVAVALAARYAPTTAGQTDRRLDPAGQIVIAVALIALISAFIQASISGWSSILVIGLFVVAVLAFASFAMIESRVRDPLLSLQLFKSLPFTGAAVVATVAFVVYAGFLFVNTLYLQDVRGYSALMAGLIVVPTTVGNVVLSPLSGRLTAERGPRVPVVVACILLLGGSLLLAFTVRDASLAALIPAYILIGSGVGLVNAPITNAAVAGLPPGRAGVAGAVTSTFRQVGNSLGVALLGTLTLSGLSGAASASFRSGRAASNAVAHTFTTGLANAYFVASGFALLALVVAAITFRPSTTRVA
jgi:EmrB/QacA subfamily drug resistance transporter